MNGIFCPSVDSPRRNRYPLQGNADVVEAENSIGGNFAKAACGDICIENGISSRGRPEGRQRRICQSQGKPSRGRNNSRRKDEEQIPKKCGRGRCATCPIFDENPIIRNTYTKKIENIINHRNCELSCKTENLIYLLECKKCGIRYVGETSQKLSERFSDHKSRIRSHNNTKKDTFLISHFNSGPCKDEDYINVKSWKQLNTQRKKMENSILLPQDIDVKEKISGWKHYIQYTQMD